MAAGGGPGGGGGGGAPPPAAAPISSLRSGQVGRCTPTLRVPASARVTEPYWHREGEAGRYTFDADAPFGLPFRPTPFYAQVALTFPGGDQVIHGLPVQYRYEGNIFSGEKRMDLLVAPAFSVRMSPEIAIIPAASVRVTPAAPPAAPARAPTPAPRAAAPRAPAAPPAPATPTVPAVTPREIRVTVVNDTPGAAESAVKLDLPQGWTALPVEQAVKFTRQDESQTVRFQVSPAANAAPGDFRVRALVTSTAPTGGATAGTTADAAQTFDRGFEVIEYPHIRRQHIYAAAAATLKVLDVRTAPNLVVGYVMGSGDEVAPVIEQLGAKVEMLGPDALAWGDLSRYNTIVLGVRAYETRGDLRANNSRLLEYVENGGTVIVQYNRAMIPDAYGPYPAQISNNRVTDEHAPVQILEPAHPVFTTPNRLSDAVWSGWVQERGLNFLGEKDSRYRDLVQLTDSFPNNPGPKRGALVEGAYGKGRWIYIALGLWREIPAGVDGAYPILANLISLGQPPPPPPAPAQAKPAAPARPGAPARPPARPPARGVPPAPTAPR